MTIDRAVPAVICLALFGLWPGASQADDSLQIERSLAQFVMISNERQYLLAHPAPSAQQKGLIKPGQPEPPAEVSTAHNIAILPQLGYAPDVGFIVGGKFSDIDFGPSHMNLDIGATQSTDGETDVEATLGTPHLLGSQFIGLVQAGFLRRTRQDFYGLGNNNVGDSSLSQHLYRRSSLTFTLARPLAPHLLLAGSIGVNHVAIGHGDPDNDKPSTVDAFGQLPGIEGGFSNPLSLSLIYNTQRDLTRPEQGWNVVGKVQHVGPELGNHYKFSRFIVDASYVHPIISSKNLIGVRVDGEYIDGSGNNLPFYELASIGGFFNLQGYERNRFVGQSRVFALVGYQRLLADFDFYNIWRVRIDGTLFGGAGRVFLNGSRLPDATRAALARLAPGRSDKIRYSYGAGLHLALGEALAVRLDAGFSPESSGLIYLSFGNAF